jgi:hypothetical protein
MHSEDTRQVKNILTLQRDKAHPEEPLGLMNPVVFDGGWTNDNVELVTLDQTPSQRLHRLAQPRLIAQQHPTLEPFHHDQSLSLERSQAGKSFVV